LNVLIQIRNFVTVGDSFAGLNQMRLMARNVTAVTIVNQRKGDVSAAAIPDLDRV
jgi:hypothetical protein